MKRSTNYTSMIDKEILQRYKVAAATKNKTLKSVLNYALNTEFELPGVEKFSGMFDPNMLNTARIYAAQSGVSLKVIINEALAKHIDAVEQL